LPLSPPALRPIGCDEYRYLSANQVGHEPFQLIALAVRKTVFDQDILTDHEASIRQPF
jgi:hypothetical protein